jgi:hypothetical protein
MLLACSAAEGIRHLLHVKCTLVACVQFVLHAAVMSLDVRQQQALE